MMTQAVRIPAKAISRRMAAGVEAGEPLELRDDDNDFGDEEGDAEVERAALAFGAHAREVDVVGDAVTEGVPGAAAVPPGERDGDGHEGPERRDPDHLPGVGAVAQHGAREPGQGEGEGDLAGARDEKAAAVRGDDLLQRIGTSCGSACAASRRVTRRTTRSIANGSAKRTFDRASVRSYRSSGSVPFAARAMSRVDRQVRIGPKGPAMTSETLTPSASIHRVRVVG